jgi:hypothetical protein
MTDQGADVDVRDFMQTFAGLVRPMLEELDEGTPGTH